MLKSAGPLLFRWQIPYKPVGLIVSFLTPSLTETQMKSGLAEGGG